MTDCARIYGCSSEQISPAGWPVKFLYDAIFVNLIETSIAPLYSLHLFMAFLRPCAGGFCHASLSRVLMIASAKGAVEGPRWELWKLWKSLGMVWWTQ
jgi:hypothetical protein